MNKTPISIGEVLNIKMKNKKVSKFYLINRANKLSHCEDNNVISAIITSEEGDTLEEYSGIIDDFRIFDKEKNWDSIQHSIEEEINIRLSKRKIIKRVLKEKEFLNIDIIFNSEDRNEGIGFCGYEFDINEKYFMQLIYISDSIYVKSQISKELLDSLRRNDIKIFHGTIYSNKVPLKFEK